VPGADRQPEPDDVVPPHSISRRPVPVVMLPRSRRTWPLGAALVLLTGAYALGSHRSADVTPAATSPAVVPASTAPAELPVLECVSVATPVSPSPIADAPPAMTAMIVRKDNVRRVPATSPPRRWLKPQGHRATDSEPDVGF
jgi:hypothetical protein